MKVFNKIIIDKALTSRTVLELIDPKKSRFQGFFRKTQPSGTRGRIGFNFTFNVSTSNYIPNRSSWHENTETIGLNAIWHNLIGKIALVLSFSGTSPNNFNLYFSEIKSFQLSRLISGVTFSKYNLS